MHIEATCRRLSEGPCPVVGGGGRKSDVVLAGQHAEEV